MLGLEDRLFVDYEDIDFSRKIDYEKVDDKHFTAQAEVELSDMFYTWVFGFGRRAKILEPVYVVDKMREYCQKVADMY